jgi:hypothetical protein
VVITTTTFGLFSTALIPSEPQRSEVDIASVFVQRPKMKIRPAIPEDVPNIISMTRGIAAYEKLSHQLEIDEPSLQESLFGKNHVPRALVALSENKIVGYAIYFYNCSTFVGRPGIYLEYLYFNINYSVKGFCDTLFKRVAQIAYDENCGRMEWIALEWNEPALNFYRSRGAKLLDDWRLLRFNREDLRNLATIENA